MDIGSAVADSLDGLCRVVASSWEKQRRVALEDAATITYVLVARFLHGLCSLL